MSFAGGNEALERVSQRPATWVHPPAWRVALAFAMAPLFVALPLGGAFAALLGPPVFLSVILASAVIAYPPTLIFGAPAYLWLIRRTPLTVGATAGTGAAVAGSGMLLMLTALMLVGPRGPNETLADNVVGLIGLSAVAGMFGALGGCVFWLIAAAGLPKKEGPPGADGSRSSAAPKPG